MIALSKVRVHTRNQPTAYRAEASSGVLEIWIGEAVSEAPPEALKPNTPDWVLQSYLVHTAD